MTIAASLRMSSGSMLHSISHALVGVVLVAPLMNRKARCEVCVCHCAEGSTAVFQGRCDVAYEQLP